VNFTLNTAWECSSICNVCPSVGSSIPLSGQVNFGMGRINRKKERGVEEKN
jgi:hypothetical protein